MPARIALLLVCCLTCRTLAEEELPTSPPPTVGVATFGPKLLQMRLLETRMVTVKRSRKVPVRELVDGKPVTKYRDEEYIAQLPETVTVTRNFTTRFIRVFNVAGEQIPAAKIADLKKQTVLLSVDGQPVPEFYRRLYRPGTLIVVAPTRVAPKSGGTPKSAPVSTKPKSVDADKSAPEKSKPGTE